MGQSREIEGAAQKGSVLRTVERRNARISVFYENPGLDVALVEVEPGATLTEPSLWGDSSWHLGLDGHAIIQQEAGQWELLPEESLRLKHGLPYSVINPAPTRMRLLTLLFKTGRRRSSREGPRSSQTLARRGTSHRKA